MTQSPRSSLGSVWDIVGYVALVLVAIVAGFLYFSEDPKPKPVEAPAAPRVVAPPESRLDRLTRQARAGDVVSQQQLGQVYYMGMDVTRDYAEGVKWLRMAADRGDAIAARILGFAYRYGHGVTKDEAQAVSWWRVAAGKGDAIASFEMSKSYLEGRGVAKSEAETLSYCRAAAERGENHAQLYLGYWYLVGYIVTKSNADALAWFRKSAVQGNADAQSYLGTMYRDGLSVPVSYDEALRWFRFAIAHRSGAGCANLAYMYFDGKGVAKDVAQGNSYLLKGALWDDDRSQMELGRRHASGIGFEADPVEGCAWYDVAAHGGQNAEAAEARDIILRSLSSSQATAMRVRSAAIVAEIKAERTARRTP